MHTILILGLTLAIGAWTVPAWADDLCQDPANKAAAKAQLAKAQTLEGAGKLREAFDAAGKVDADCANSDELKKQIAKAIASDEERKGHLDEAIDWYQRANDHPDATRVIRKVVEDRPGDIPAIGRAIDYFHVQNNKAQEQAMRAVAAKNVDMALAVEEKRFATQLKDSLGTLQTAQDWTFYAQTGQDRVRARAALRGDTLAKEDGRVALRKALDFYFVGSLNDSMKRVKAKASALGKQHEAKGELETAAEYYTIADEGSKAEAILKQLDASNTKIEESRKKTFKKDQGDLEKSLGF